MPDKDREKDAPEMDQRVLDKFGPVKSTPLRDTGSSVEDKFGKDYASTSSRNDVDSGKGDLKRKASDDEDKRKKKKEKRDKKDKGEKKSKIAPTSEPMIVVNVNDRLGTKAAIPCLASDPIRLFKAQVAARIGREPHEIMLKRQGERPFKDHLTLEDYGVSNGVQLDLEVDTGD